ncbi:MAG: hypothetical protein AAF411_06855 [Myxococcota bacterium]
MTDTPCNISARVAEGQRLIFTVEGPLQAELRDDSGALQWSGGADGPSDPPQRALAALFRADESQVEPWLCRMLSHGMVLELELTNVGGGRWKAALRAEDVYGKHCFVDAEHDSPFLAVVACLALWCQDSSFTALQNVSPAEAGLAFERCFHRSFIDPV